MKKHDISWLNLTISVLTGTNLKLPGLTPYTLLYHEII